MYFQNFQSTGCCLCGEPNNLTGEHKIKRSALKAELGETELYVGQSGNGRCKPKFAQSTRSKHLKFKARICESCNTDKTQPADREFDNFNEITSEILSSGGDPTTVFDLPQYREGTVAYLNVFRYFAKLLCCHLAEIQAPCPIRISNFAIGRSEENYIFLDIKKDWTFEKISKQIGEIDYAAHGGLIVYGDKLSGLADGFHSTLTIGSLQYVFYIKLGNVEKLEMEELYPEFSAWCQAKVKQAKESPLSVDECQSQGLI